MRKVWGSRGAWRSGAGDKVYIYNSHSREQSPGEAQGDTMSG